MFPDAAISELKLPLANAKPPANAENGILSSGKVAFKIPLIETSDRN